MFDISSDSSVVTSRKITAGNDPILYVAHQRDDDGVIWQFLDGHEFTMADMQLVRLETILRLDPEIISVSNTPIGCVARRDSPRSPWVISPDPDAEL